MKVSAHRSGYADFRLLPAAEHPDSRLGNLRPTCGVQSSMRRRSSRASSSGSVPSIALLVMLATALWRQKCLCIESHKTLSRTAEVTRQIDSQLPCMIKSLHAHSKHQESGPNKRECRLEFDIGR